MPRPTAIFHSTASVGLVRAPSICESAARLTPLRCARSSRESCCVRRWWRSDSATWRASSAAPNTSPELGATRGRAWTLRSAFEESSDSSAPGSDSTADGFGWEGALRRTFLLEAFAFTAASCGSGRRVTRPSPELGRARSDGNADGEQRVLLAVMAAPFQRLEQAAEPCSAEILEDQRRPIELPRHLFRELHRAVAVHVGHDHHQLRARNGRADAVHAAAAHVALFKLQLIPR